jgi:hypothetical protein
MGYAPGSKIQALRRLCALACSMMLQDSILHDLSFPWSTLRTYVLQDSMLYDSVRYDLSLGFHAHDLCFQDLFPGDLRFRISRLGFYTLWPTFQSLWVQDLRSSLPALRGSTPGL